MFCKLVGANADNDLNVNLIQGQLCDICDPKSSSKRHPPEYAVDGNPTWWQSPPLSRGMKYNEVNLTIDLGQEFHVAYVFIRMGNSPRPGLWILEKSADYGSTWSPWQYFSDSKADCDTYFGKESLEPISRDDSVVCTTEFSKILPLEGGEIAISTLKHRPSAHNYFNSSVLQEWTRATNIRFRLLRTKNLLGHLMSVQRQDPTVTRRYFYSISDISIGGRCMCNGHADSCDVTDPDDPGILLCRCRHHTCGAKCQLCCPGYEQKAWRISKASQPFICEACNCFNHTDKCTYDSETDAKHLSLDIHGNYEGGGVCQECQHNTEGINCNKCRSRYYRPSHKQWNETDVCHRCNCDFAYSTGNCAEGIGRCECKPAFQPPDCDSCAFGYYAYPDCKPCECFLQGTLHQQCQDDESGTCHCKKNFGGHDCRQCADQYYSFPDCEPCECNPLSSTSITCNQNTGNCTCQINFAGKQCDSCASGYYNYPTCSYCDCDQQGTLPSICDPDKGKCQCRPGYGGSRCDSCLPGFTGYPQCVPCNCSVIGSVSASCDAVTGKCVCLGSYAGRACAQCSVGNYKYPDCLACNCDTNGGQGTSCDNEGLCQCHHNFDGQRCNKCKEGFYNFPRCEDCNCHPAGVVQQFAGCGSVPEGELCECKKRVEGRICDRCKPLYWHLHAANPDGCERCECDEAGVLAGIHVCDVDNGQCTCKPTVVGRQCSECSDGTYQLEKENLFGCTDCGCDVGGAVSPLCDKASGQCACQPRVTGRTCTEPLQTHYFPTLYQYLYEVEDGRTPQNTPVRYGYDEKQFPDYSWRGYAIFSQLQTEIIQDIHLTKPSLYRMVLRYVNTHSEPIIGFIRITPENPNDAEQKHAVLFKPTNSSGGEHVTVSGAAGNIPSALVMNPGRWSVSVVVEKSMLLDYFVLLPEDFYLATILNERVETPCTVKDPASLCRVQSYPNVSRYDASWGTGGYIDLGEGRIGTLQDYLQDKEHLQSVGLKQRSIPLLHPNQEVIDYNITLSKPGEYVLLVDYLTPLDDLRTHTVSVNIIKSDYPEEDDEANKIATGDNGDKIVLYKCPYVMVCRQAAITSDGVVAVYKVDENSLHVQLKGNNSNVGIYSLAAIPASDWNLDYIQPRPVCVRKNGRCIPSKYPSPPETKKIQFEQETLDSLARKNNKESDLNVDDDNNKEGDENDIGGSATNTEKVKLYRTNTSTYVELEGGAEDGMFDLKAKVPNPGLYTVIVHYYQPDFPEFEAELLIQNGQMYEAKVPLSHCPSTSGCRAVVAQINGDNKFQLIENFIAAFKVPRNKHVYLDYLLVVPYDLFNIRLLEEEDLDRTGEFIATCGNNHFHIGASVSGFCRKSIFSITSGHNNGALYCQCDYDGSQSFECSAFGGQCPCRPHIVGRTCSACKTGYYGFPDCKPCHCPSTAICEPITGQCICPKHVTGERCDVCKPYTYGFDPIIGCEECKCNALGVTNSLQCDLLTGNCVCKANIVGRQCADCANGHYYFPYCEQCECAAAGTIESICDPNTAECLCKKQVTGPNCSICKEGAYNLDETNPDGCTECFCFGKTSRCIDSNLVRTRLYEMVSWKLVTLEEPEDGGPLVVTPLDLTVHQGEDNTVGVDFTDTSYYNKIVYFSAPNDYLQKQLSSYGAIFEYHVFYTIGTRGKATMAADVILHGANTHVNHMGESHPSPAQQYQSTLNLKEENFALPNGVQAKREHIMTVLQDLRGVFIRATYWNDSVTSKISNVFLGSASPLSDYRDPFGLPMASSVEQCLCPPNYKGSSCEECAPGHYRTPTVGPHGGFCVPCQCNGHADICDVDTGICTNCQHNTWGDHCEICSVGYHGNALQGTPNDCLICACPLPLGSNNFATACDVSSDGERIDCECTEGYIGDRCQGCGAGFFGRPEFISDYCKPCQCSGNIRPDDPKSCDTLTGVCTNCLNNTYGEACALCAPSFFGDAILRKDCQSCVCDDLGTARCNSYTGDCECLPHVVGDKCDRCESEHYGFQAGGGCIPCACGEASISGQCDDVTGQCRCAPGVTGRQCDRCSAGWWNYTKDGCVSCGCKSEYSLGVSCNPETGRCECLRGVDGEKCDRCPHRWAFLAEFGCHDCDRCVHDLLDSTDELAMIMDGVLKEFDNVDSGFFTTRKLAHINDTIRSLTPRISLLSPDGINLSPLVKVVDLLEQDAKNINRKVNYSLENSETLGNEASNIKDNATLATKNLLDALNEIDDIIDNIELISSNIFIDDGPRLDQAVTEAQQFLDEIKAHNITDYDNNAQQQLEKVNGLLDELGDFKAPVNEVTKDVKNVTDQMKAFDMNLDDLNNQTKYAMSKGDDAEKLHGNDGKNRVEKKLAIIQNTTYDSQANLNASHALLRNATENYKKAKEAYKSIALKPDSLPQLQRDLSEKLHTTYLPKTDEIDEILMPQVVEHAANLSRRAEEFDEMLRETRNTSEGAVRAATAYNDINKAIEEAETAANKSNDIVDDATEMLTDIEGRTMDALAKSEENLLDAHESVETVAALKSEVKEAASSYAANRQSVKQTDDKVNEVLKFLDNNDSPQIDKWLVEAKEKADEASAFNKNIAEQITGPFKDVKEGIQKAKDVPKKLDNANNNIEQVRKQIRNAVDRLPSLLTKVDEVEQAGLGDLTPLQNGISERIKKLQEQIAIARDLADRISIGLKLHPNTTLQVRNPPNLAEGSSTSTRLTGYFRTPRHNDLIIYVGNGVGTKLRGTQTDDYMALQLEAGYPVLSLDLGNGQERIVHNKFVADDQWYQFIIERTGLNAQLSIRAENPDGTEQVYTEHKQLEGPLSIFNLDQNKSKIFVGSYDSDFHMQDTVRQQTFEGEIEDITIADRPVSLWNFVKGENNNEGANARDKLVNLMPSTGYRFNEGGYAILDARSYALKSRSDIQLSFKTFAEDGLLFLCGGDKTFIALEIRNGKVLYKYNLGFGTKVWYTRDTYNDGQWHTVQADRDGHNGKFVVDGVEISDETPQVAGHSIEINDTLFFGGYPRRHPFREVTNQHFDGCIDNVSIRGSPVDLSDNIKAYGVTPGCPDKFARLVSFLPHQQHGHLRLTRLSTSNDLTVNLKFKTRSPDGLIFYLTDPGQTNGVSLSLIDGELHLISCGLELVTNNVTFNDNEWHVISVRHNKDIRLDYDDYGYKAIADSDPPKLHILYGDLYIGGVPDSFKPKKGSVATTTTFGGCIGDATVQGDVINFANTTDKSSEQLGKCVLDKQQVGSETDVHQVPELPPLEELDHYTTLNPDLFTEEPVEFGVPKRGDGGKDGEFNATSDRFGQIDEKPPPAPEQRPPTTSTSTTTTTAAPVVVPEVPLPPPKHPKKPDQTEKPPPPEGACALPLIPKGDENAVGTFKFAREKDSRLEYPSSRGKFKKQFTFDVEFKTFNNSGIILYVADTNHSQYVTLYLEDGFLVYKFASGRSLMEIRSPLPVNDGQWRSVHMVREQAFGQLIIDTQPVLNATAAGSGLNKLDLYAPYYLGGVNGELHELIKDNVGNTDGFDGCIRSFNMNNRRMESPVEMNVMLCSEYAESGTFFGAPGGYVKLKERFKVGLEIDIKLDIKPRNTSGLLVAVHGKKDYLVLEMIHGVIKLSVDNGKGPITTSFEPPTPFYFCDGHWHNIQAVKSKSVVTLSVDRTFTQPGVGDHRHASTNTISAFFLGGHRQIGRARGLVARVPYIGCMRRVQINGQRIEPETKMVDGNVTLGSCATN